MEQEVYLPAQSYYIMNKESTATPKLTAFPPELLEYILAQIGTAQTLTRLSQTCKGLHVFIEQEGYRILVQRRFPSVAIPASALPRTDGNVGTLYDNSKFWKDAAHGLTTLSRNWDRRAFIAQAIQEPGSKRTEIAAGIARGRRRRGPTIGFIPVIDSYEAWYGAGWTSRKEVVAWGAGAKLVIRSRTMGTKPLEESPGAGSDRALTPYWRTYSKKGALEGRDDITTVNLMPQRSNQFEELILGRASGGLELLRLDQKSTNKTLATYATGGMPVRYTTMHRHTGGVAAACLGDHNVSLYPLNLVERDVEPCASASVQKVGENARTWSAKFLNKGRFAVGLGRSTHPIHIYDLGQGTSKLEHVTHLSLNEGTTANRVDVAGAMPHATSIYSLASLSPSFTSAGAEGDVFLSGAYDAYVRYDSVFPLSLRSQNVSYVWKLSDFFSRPVYTISVFPLQSFLCSPILSMLILQSTLFSLSAVSALLQAAQCIH